MRTFVRTWWPLPAIVLAVVVVQIWWTGRYDVPGGHASGHFMNSSAIFGFTVACAVLLWALPAAERRSPLRNIRPCRHQPMSAILPATRHSFLQCDR